MKDCYVQTLGFVDSIMEGQKQKKEELQQKNGSKRRLEGQELDRVCLGGDQEKSIPLTGANTGRS
jgi:hypothetical protein